MENNYETLVSLYCDLSKPELLSRLERGEEPCAPAEPDLEGADVSAEPAGEPDRLSAEGLLEMKTKESCEGNRREPEGSRSPAVTVNCSAREWQANPADAKGPGPLPGSVIIIIIIAPFAFAAHVPPEATAVPADLSQPTPSPSYPLSTCCREVVNLKLSPSPPAAAADAEVGIPTEVPQEEVAAEKPVVPETPSKGLEEEDRKDLGDGGQGPVADVPEEPVKEAIPDVCRAMAQADSACLGEPVEGSCVSRTAACQRNSTREKFYSCPVCRKTFLLKINLVIHQRSHSNLVPYICTHCDRSFMSKKKIRRHLRARAAKGFCQPSEAEECPSRAPCPASQPQTPSRDCGTVLGKPSPTGYPLSPGKRMYTCDECMENFSSESFLILHQRRHTNHHLILCPCCNRSFTWASDFVRHGHQRIHVRQKRLYPCGDPLPVPAVPV
ncbi:PREDICTED: zinc finger protein 777-like [Charadrius vociferus]|uniref:zinc finger protein 777-like n=1 Tax=Charadrius vociferus TaxID=50402 RepID=UPI00052178C9|nr:PREDICTED: zinc finger protein 777-like [Charadrius vociferus]